MGDTWTKENRENRTPMALLSYQAEWVEDLSPVKVMEKSRRIGISWAEAADDSLLAASDSGMDVWYIGYNKDMAQEFIEDCGDWSRYYGLAAGEISEVVIADEDKDIQSYRIRFASGWKITALSSRPSNLRGKQGKIVIDEAAFHPDLAGLIKAALAMLVWGGRVAFISTHNGDDNEFNDLVKDIRAGKTDYSIHRVTIDDAIEQGLYERICLRLNREYSREAEAAWLAKLLDDYGSDADEELRCIPSQGSGVYLPRHLIEGVMNVSIPVLRLSLDAGFSEKPDHVRESEIEAWLDLEVKPWLDTLDENQRHYFGEDFGRSGDLSVIVPLAQRADLTYRAPFVIEERNVPFRQQEQILFYVIERLPRFSGGALDARGNGQYLAEVTAQKFGHSRVRQVMLSEPWYRENMPPYKAAFEDKAIALPKDADILDDHRAVKMIKGVAKVPDKYEGLGADGGQRHGDSAIAGALGWFAVRETEYGEVEYRSVSPRRTAGIKGAW
jgi:phage FluMu gp28-like protein